MPDGVVDPPSGLTVGQSSGGTGGGINKKYLYAGGGVALLGLIYLYAKSKSASSSASTTTSPEVISPASNQDSTAGDIGSALTLQGQQNTASLTNSLSSALTELEGIIAGNQSATLAAIAAEGGQNVQPGTPAPAPVTISPAPAAALPAINASAWPQIIKYLQDPNAATDFTPIGQVNNGVFSGSNVTGGVPVYAGVDGGYAQGFDESTLPSGTELYIPTALKQYET